MQPSLAWTMYFVYATRHVYCACVYWWNPEDAEWPALSCFMLFLLMVSQSEDQQPPSPRDTVFSPEVTGSTHGHVQHFPWVLVSELRSSQASAARAYTQSYLLSPPTLTPGSLPQGLGFAGVCHHIQFMHSRARSQSFLNARQALCKLG